jgi:hypothetical protein
MKAGQRDLISNILLLTAILTPKEQPNLKSPGFVRVLSDKIGGIKIPETV